MAKNQTTSEIVPTNILTDDDLRNVTSFSDALETFKERDVSPVRSTDELGNGFIRTDKKSQFVGVPLMFVQWEFRAGDQSVEYVEANIITRDNGRYTITDGGTGIYAQLRAYSDRTGIHNGMLAEEGLTSSEYRVCQDCKKPNSQRVTNCRFCNSDNLGWGETFYISQ